MKPAHILLVISLIANAAMGWAYLSQRDKAVATGVREGQAVAVALECGRGTQDIEDAAERRQQEAAPKVEEARRKADEHNREADRILQRSPAPGDACASAQAELDDWWQRRARP